VLGVRTYGTDYAAIAEVIGNKMASHVRNFFITCRQRFHLDEILCSNEHNLSSVRHARIVKHSGDQPPEVYMSFLRCTAIGKQSSVYDGFILFVILLHLCTLSVC